MPLWDPLGPSDSRACVFEQFRLMLVATGLGMRREESVPLRVPYKRRSLDLGPILTQ